MDNFLVYYSGGCFERGDSPEQAEKKAYDKVSSLGNVLRIEATTVGNSLKGTKYSTVVPA
jgi:hypothetical protein